MVLAFKCQLLENFNRQWFGQINQKFPSLSNLFQTYQIDPNLLKLTTFHH